MTSQVGGVGRGAGAGVSSGNDGFGLRANVGYGSGAAQGRPNQQPPYGGANSYSRGSVQGGAAASNSFGNAGAGDGPRAPMGAGGSRACFNCQQPGHMAAACPNPRVPRDGDAGDRPTPVTYVPQVQSIDELMAQRVQVGLNFAHITQEHVRREGNAVDKVPVFETFEQAQLPPQVLANLQRLGYADPTPVQRNVMPILMAGRDVLASAQTGSGKTAAFLLPIIANMINENNFAQPNELKPRALVVAPTRELVIQIANEARKFAHGTTIRVCEVYGGVRVAYHMGNVQGASIIVGTIGRLRHFLQSGVIHLEMCQFLVIDEVDRMLLDSRSKNEERDLPELIENHGPVSRLASRFTKDTCLVGVGLVGAANKDIQQSFIQVPSRYQKKDSLLELLRNENQQARARGGQIGRTLIFVNERKTTDVLAMILSSDANEIPSISIHGLREQRERETALTAFRSGKCRVLIATAVCERGLDIKDVDHVINYDLPDDVGQYVHRIGRTGRVGHSGRATSLFETGRDDRLIGGLKKVLMDAGQPVPDFMSGGGAFFEGNTAAAGVDEDAW